MEMTSGGGPAGRWCLGGLAGPCEPVAGALGLDGGELEPDVGRLERGAGALGEGLGAG
jgi:hypothetical protein